MKFDKLLNQYIFPLREAIESVIVGQRHVINRVVMALFAVGQRDFYPDGSRFLGTGHVLCEGGTGTGKTVLCKLLARLLAGNNKRVSGMPDALASDITGCEIILLTGNTKTVQGPLFCNVMLADEINRFPPKAQNAFIEALAEGSVTIGNETYRLQQPFFCLATQNPTEQKGTSRIQEALADRFMFKLVMRETTEDEKIEIAKRTHNFDLSKMHQIVSSSLICEAREQLFDNVYVSDETRKYCAKLIHAINHPEEFGMYKDELGVIGTDPLFKQKPPLNDRSMLHLEGASMMEAIMQQRDYVTPYDVVAVAPDVFRVRLIVADSSNHLLLSSLPGKYRSETELVDNLINQALNKVGL
jgi:MoxR-like ATPase